MCLISSEGWGKQFTAQYGGKSAACDGKTVKEEFHSNVAVKSKDKMPEKRKINVEQPGHSLDIKLKEKL